MHLLKIFEQIERGCTAAVEGDPADELSHLGSGAHALEFFDEGLLLTGGEEFIDRNGIDQKTDFVECKALADQSVIGCIVGTLPCADIMSRSRSRRIVRTDTRERLVVLSR